MGDRVAAVIRVRHTIRRGAGLDARASWRRQLTAWLAECSALVLRIFPGTSETFYRTEPEAGGTRVTMTFRAPFKALTREQRERITGEVSETVNRNKTLIEDTVGQA